MITLKYKINKGNQFLILFPSGVKQKITSINNLYPHIKNRLYLGRLKQSLMRLSVGLKRSGRINLNGIISRKRNDVMGRCDHNMVHHRIAYKNQTIEIR